MKEITHLQNSVQGLIDDSSQSTVKITDAGDEGANGVSGAKLLDKLENLQDRWEALSQIMEAQSQRVSYYHSLLHENARSSELNVVINNLA